MGARLSIAFGIFALIGVGAWSVASRHDDDDRRFEAHEFAVFRSEYESLRVQSPEKRVEHFRDLLETTETARLTPGMDETLSEFCRKVATSEEESPTVQAEARLVLHALEAKRSDRSPAAEKPAK